MLNSHLAEFPELLITTRSGQADVTRCAEEDVARWSHAGQCTNPGQCTNCSPGNCGQCFGISDSARRSALAGEGYYCQAQTGQCTNCAQCANCTPGNCGQCGWISDAERDLWAEGEKYYDQVSRQP